MTAQLTAYRWVPPFAQGYVRDLRIRWALEEAGLPYEIVLIDVMNKGDDYRRWQPFSQVPAYRDEGIEMFESGAILLHLAAKSDALAPQDPAGQARVASWVFAATNSIEPFAQNRIQLEAVREKVEPQLDRRLAALAETLGDKDWLEGRFTAGDIMMVVVLRELVDCGVLARFPTLDAYRQRGEARPAFGRALEDQMRTFRENAPA